MKFLIDNWMLILLAVSSGGLLLWQGLQKNAGGGVGAAIQGQVLSGDRNNTRWAISKGK